MSYLISSSIAGIVSVHEWLGKLAASDQKCAPTIMKYYSRKEWHPLKEDDIVCTCCSVCSCCHFLISRHENNKLLSVCHMQLL